MLHCLTPSPERFSALAPDPADDLERLRRNLDRGTVRAEHLVLATTGEGTDAGRLALYTHPDGATVAYGFRVAPAWEGAEELYGTLLDGLDAAARSTGLARMAVSVVDAEDWASGAKRAALLSRGWILDGGRLELQVTTAGIGLTGKDSDLRAETIREIDPSDPAVLRVMAAAMANSLDDYDRTQVAEHGPEAAAAGYRDMMAESRLPVPWLAHHGPDGIDGILAIQAYPTDWCLGYLAVAPEARRAGVGTALTRALLAATARAGVPVATASVAMENTPIRGTLEKAGFRVASARTDFMRRLDGRDDADATTEPATGPA